MSRAKIRRAQELLVAPGPFEIAELTDPHDGIRVAELSPERAREVVAWYRQLLRDSETLGVPNDGYAERLAALDAWLADESG